MKKYSTWEELVFLIIKIIAIILFFIIIFTFLYGAIRYPEASMNPAIKDGDLVFYYRYTRDYLPQDVIVLNTSGYKQVRRVIATAGDIVDITEEGLLVNGALQQEPEIYQRTYKYHEGVNFPLTVQKGEVFVLADSRIGTTDSRIYGCVRIENTLGKVMTIIRRRSI